MTTEQKQARAQAKEEAKKALRIENEKNQKPVQELTITIEWKKSKTWGANPHASVRGRYTDGQYFSSETNYTCTGCGYDKESTVIADIFNDFLKYKLHQLQQTEGRPKTPYGARLGEWLGYEGGVGTSSYYRIGEFIGGKFENIASGKTFGVFKWTSK